MDNTTVSPAIDEGNGNNKVVTLYSKKKTIAEGLFDVALLMAYATLLKTLVTLGDSYRFYSAMMVMLILSIVLQFVIGIMLVYVGATEGKKEDDVRTNRMHNATLILIFIVTFLNVFITAFGIEFSSG
ncbi:hypothetical protein KUTeg_020701 [Tegillarca granosa]|uniref:Uncharacterized protein n=1 Tax=Tegillarca granosa TaxID=220873 RepID=A0ABQ9E8Q7_TEGGR|nr:hypothetical protein KUTeg_020701 [Tegillarca granosa]